MAGLLSKLELQIMELLTQKPVDGMYGLEILEKSGHTIPKGSIYVTLGRMSHKGYVESHRSDPVNGPSRRYFTLTAPGKRALSLHRELERFAGTGGATPEPV